MRTGAKLDNPRPGQETPRLADYGHLPSRGELELVRGVQGGPLAEAGAALLAAACGGRAEEGAVRLIPPLRHTPAAASLPPQHATRSAAAIVGPRPASSSWRRFLRG
jgi:hypothetical protein